MQKKDENTLCVQFNCHRKKYDKYNFLGCFMKLDVCVLLNTFYGSVLALIGFAINTLCVFKILSIHLVEPAYTTLPMP